MKTEELEQLVKKATPLPWNICGSTSGCGCAKDIATISGKRIASVGDHHFRAAGDLHEMYNAYINHPGFDLPETNAQLIEFAVNNILPLTKQRDEAAFLLRRVLNDFRAFRAFVGREIDTGTMEEAEALLARIEKEVL